MEGAGNPWASSKPAGIFGGSNNDPFGSRRQRYDALLGSLPALGSNNHNGGNASLFTNNAAGVPGSVYAPGGRRRAHQDVAYEHEGPDPTNSDDDDRYKRRRKPAVPDIIGLGEPYTVADDFKRMQEIKVKGNVRKEPLERGPWEALKKYVKDAGLERPKPADDYFSTRDSVDMYVTTFDYVRLPQKPENSWGKDGAVVRMFGVTNEGHSGAVFVHNFWPYLAAELPTKLSLDIAENGEEAALGRFKEWLNLQVKLRDVKRDVGHQPSCYIRSVELIRNTHRSIYYLQLDPGMYIKIETQLPRFVPLVRDVLSKRHFVPTEKGKPQLNAIAPPKDDEYNYQPAAEEEAENEQNDDMVLDTENTDVWMLPDEETLHTYQLMRKPENHYGTAAVQVFECDIQFVLRFMVDNDVSGCGWISVPKDAVEFAALNGVPINPESVDLGSTAQISLAVDATKLISLKARADVPDELRKISIDIESATSKTRQFPIPSSDPIICLSVNLCTHSFFSLLALLTSNRQDQGWNETASTDRLCGGRHRSDTAIDALRQFSGRPGLERGYTLEMEYRGTKRHAPRAQVAHGRCMGL